MTATRGRPSKALSVDFYVGVLLNMNTVNDGKGATPEELNVSDYLINRKNGIVELGYAERSNRHPPEGSKGRPSKIYALTNAGREYLAANKPSVTTPVVTSEITSETVDIAA